MKEENKDCKPKVGMNMVTIHYHQLEWLIYVITNEKALIFLGDKPQAKKISPTLGWWTKWERKTNGSLRCS